ncbi:MAG: DUF262 domain-containing protein, partial [Gammaproteobacteria bacterium]|nr:DUF262 domain-containing protein [Gammaproteobacteria bacterium]
MSLELRSVNRLLVDENGAPARYWIPAYQRGYRWNQQQVKQLLDDVWDFIQTGEGEFYCLQPLVVKQWDDGRFEVVDGQQRLTTIYVLLVLDRLKAIVEMARKQPFTIEYETRDGSFLKNIDCIRADENIDFHYICEARQAIEDWLHSRDGSHALKLMQHLLADDEADRNVRVIWYELVLVHKLRFQSALSFADSARFAVGGC